MADRLASRDSAEVHFDQRGFFRILAWFMTVMVGLTIAATGLITNWDWSVGGPIAVALVLITGLPILGIFRHLLLRDNQGLWISGSGLRLVTVGAMQSYRWEHVGPIVMRRYLFSLMQRTSMVEVSSIGTTRHIPLIWFGTDGGAAAAAAIESFRASSTSDS